MFKNSQLTHREPGLPLSPLGMQCGSRIRTCTVGCTLELLRERSFKNLNAQAVLQTQPTRQKQSPLILKVPQVFPLSNRKVKPSFIRCNPGIFSQKKNINRNYQHMNAYVTLHLLGNLLLWGIIIIMCILSSKHHLQSNCVKHMCT